MISHHRSHLHDAISSKLLAIATSVATHQVPWSRATVAIGSIAISLAAITNVSFPRIVAQQPCAIGIIMTAPRSFAIVCARRGVVASVRWRASGEYSVIKGKGANRGKSSHPEPTPSLVSDNTPKSNYQIRDLNQRKIPRTRRRYAVITKGFEAQELTIVGYVIRITSLEEEVARLK